MAKIPVVFTFDKRIILAGAVAIKSLIDCAKEDTQYDIFVFHPDLNQKTIKEFQTMTKDTRHSLSFKCVSKEHFKNAPINKFGSWNEIVYYRLIIPEILSEYDKVIYSDVDVLFKDDLSDLYNENIENQQWAGVRAEKNTPNTIGHKYFEQNKNEFIYWSGLMLINCKKWREQNLFKILLANAEKYYDSLKLFDLDLVNITCDEIAPVSLKYCLLQSFVNNEDITKAPEYRYLKDVYTIDEIKSAKEKPAIIHYAGKPGKPWHLKKPPIEYTKYVNLIPKKLKKYTFRDIRKKLFSKV